MEAGDPGLWGSYFVRMAGILIMWGSYFVRMWGSAGGSEEVMLAPRFLGCTWNRPYLTERTRTDQQQWMASFLCPLLRIFCVVVKFALFFCFTLCCSELTARYFDHKSSEAQKPNPPICWVDKKISQKEKKEKCAVGGKELLDIKGHLLSWNRSLRLWLRSQDCLASPILYKIPRDVWKPRLELVI